jgi:hypothetical protein
LGQDREFPASGTAVVDADPNTLPAAGYYISFNKTLFMVYISGNKYCGTQLHGRLGYCITDMATVDGNQGILLPVMSHCWCIKTTMETIAGHYYTIGNRFPFWTVV